MTEIMTTAILIFVALLYFCKLIHSKSTEFLTQEEAKHAGVKYESPPIITQFLNSKFSKRDGLQINDFLAHHRIVKEFCLSIKKKCTWSEVCHLIVLNLAKNNVIYICLSI